MKNVIKSYENAKIEDEIENDKAAVDADVSVDVDLQFEKAIKKVFAYF